MSTFIRDTIERATVSRRNLLLGAAAGMGAMALPMALGRGAARAALTDPAIAWSYRDRASAYWNAIVSGGESFVESIGRPRTRSSTSSTRGRRKSRWPTSRPS